MSRVPPSLMIAPARFTLLALLAAICGGFFADCARAQEADDTARPPDERGAGTAIKRHPLKVGGRALDPGGRPIAGATVFLVSTNNSPAEHLGKAVTGPDGRYEFPDARLPVTGGQPRDLPESGCFRLFGKAPGCGIAWCGLKYLITDLRAEGVNGGLPRRLQEHQYLQGEEIEINLIFAPPMVLAGRCIDEQGEPIKGVALQLLSCDYLNTAGKERDQFNREFRGRGLASELIPDQLQVVSDAEGRFAFKSIPADTICQLQLEHPDYGSRFLYTATADDPPAVTDGDHAVLLLPLKLTLQRVRAIAVQVVSEKTGLPITGARISASVERASVNFSTGTSDPEGKALLKLPPGEYRLSARPPRGSTENWIPTSQTLVVGKTDDVQMATLNLRSGGIVILKALESGTKQGISGMTFRYTSPAFNGAREVRSDTSRTNDKGELRVVLPPGQFKFRVGFPRFPQDYRPAPGLVEGTELELKAGDEISVEFLLTKEAAPP
jgi:protocatechuate 3,4-dioxygenase beta subunit